MPTRTELIISIGEVLECLPPGKAYRRKRFNSFDVIKALESGNEENVAPLAETGARCDLSETGMKSRENGILETEAEPQVLTIRRKTRGSEDESRKDSTDPGDEDDEVSFNPDTVNTIAENGITNGDESTSKSKSKRKSSAEKFLEDNASYFQLEVLSSKTRSSKTFETNGESSEKEPVGFHNSFLDFLKSKGVEGKDEEPGERSRSRHKSGPSGGIQRKSRPRTSSCRHSPVRSDSEDSVRAPRSRSQYSKVRSRSRDYSPSESEPEISNGKLALSKIRKKEKTPSKCIDSSDDESEGSYTKSTRSRTKPDSVCSPSPGKKSRRSELDKLLEAVDTSFHFETAAAAAKRISGSQELGPLEIDVSDSNIESGDEKELVSKNKKRKHSESDTESEGKRKKKKNVSGDLLKTFSPRSNKKSPKVNEDSDHEIDETGEVWDGWETLNQTLAATDSLPVEADKLHFSFEATPFHESWFQTYSRQDCGEDVVFYPESKSFPFMLPYELPYSTFIPYKPEGKQDENLRKKGVKKNLLGDSEDTLPLKKKKKKVSECESTDSENNRKGKSKLGPKADHLLDLHPRISPRCHASTKAILHEGPHLTDEELAEALLIQDERDFHFPSFVPFLNHDETSNDSLASAKHFKRENIADFVQIASSMDRYLRNTETLTEVDLSAVATPSKSSKEKGSDKVTVPTRSRISSEELLKTMKDKPKKKKDKLLNGNVVLDQVVADHVDAILLDCLEEELPTIPFESEERETISLLDSYQSCNSMNVCNSRWLRPSRPSVLGKDGSASLPRKSVFPFKPKRLVIYKEDLPGFKFDNDIETEKLPVSKRFLAKSAQQEEADSGEDEKEDEEESKTVKKEKKVVKKQIKKEVFISRKEKLKVEPKEEKDEDDVSLPDSSAEPSPRAKTKSKPKKTGFPVTKKKTKLKPDAVVTKKTKKVPIEKKSPNEKKTEKKVKESVQLKTDKFITKKKSGSPRSSISRQVEGRRTALQAKNYSEIESDTESLFESKVPYRSPHMKLLKQKPISSKSKTKTK